MKKYGIEELNNKFSIVDHKGSSSDDTRYTLWFKTGKGGIPLVEIKNKLANATISLQGAHLLSWIPASENEVIWVSDDATYVSGKSIRGGIPVCWPWFGAHETHSSYPSHGFARTSNWQVTDTQQLITGATRITFKLDTRDLDEATQRMWPMATVVEYAVTIAKSLTIELTTYNNSGQTMTIGQALHTYFSVGDVTNTTVYGLEDKVYLDKTDGFERKIQSGPVVIGEEVDRVYLQTDEDIIIDNKIRKIVIKKQGSQSTVVWNPWKDIAEKMGDLGREGYLKMLCVESANAQDDTVSINAGECAKLVVIYDVDDGIK